MLLPANAAHDSAMISVIAGLPVGDAGATFDRVSTPLRLVSSAPAVRRLSSWPFTAAAGYAGLQTASQAAAESSADASGGFTS